MKETDDVRNVRRDLSKQLTEKINDATHYPWVRGEVLNALQNIDSALEACQDNIRDEYHLKCGSYRQQGNAPQGGEPLLQFYMKGGNAYSCILDPTNDATRKRGGGNTDWDTQIIVNPWLPLPIQQRLYAEIEDIVAAELKRAAPRIGGRILAGDPNYNLKDKTETLTVNNLPAGNGVYQVKLDDPQTERRIVDRNQLGLWLTPGGKVGKKSDLPPSIIINDAIAPFVLYRLGYTWHVDSTTTPPLQVEKPILMELIDVTLPRRNTVEAVEVWSARIHLNIQIYSVGVEALQYFNGPMTAQDVYQLPLPGLDYHFQEISLMLCEIATGRSSSTSKLGKRLVRFNEMFYNNQLSTQRKLEILFNLAGVDVRNVQETSQTVAALFAMLGPAMVTASTTLTQGHEGFFYARKLMASVEQQQSAPAPSNAQQGRIDLKGVLDTVFAKLNVAFLYSWSDDILVREILDQSRFIDTTHLRPVLKCFAVLRTTGIDRVAQAIHTRLHGIHSQTNELIEVRSRWHNTVRSSGISYENTLVIFVGFAPVYCITLTTAIRIDVSSGALGSKATSITEVANQRLIAASMIENFLVRTALDDQLSALKSLLPGL